MNVLSKLNSTLINEAGMPPMGVAIWRMGESGSCYTMTVGEFLSKPENQSGTWLIDGGWGGPPGPIHVEWDEENKVWINQGFCGHLKQQRNELPRTTH